MALSAEDKRRIVELASGGEKRKNKGADDSAGMNLAGSAAAPIPLGMLPRAGRQPFFSASLGGTVRIALFVSIPLVLLLAAGLYARRYDLQKMDVGAVFDSAQGPNIRARFMEQVRLQKRKRALLDAGQAFSFANDHLSAVHSTDEVLGLDPNNAEALALRAMALDRQVVFAAGALDRGDVDEAVSRVQRVLAVAAAHDAGRDLLHRCTSELVRRAENAFDAQEYSAAGALTHQAETIVPGFAPAVRLHGALVRLHVSQADTHYVNGDFVEALEEIEFVRRLEVDNPRTAALFEKIDVKVGFPDITINSILTLGGKSMVMAEIQGSTRRLGEGQTYRNVRVKSIEYRSGRVVFEQIYTGEQVLLIKTPGGKGTWMTGGR